MIVYDCIVYCDYVPGEANKVFQSYILKASKYYCTTVLQNAAWHLTVANINYRSNLRELIFDFCRLIGL